MQHHSAQHILTQASERELGAATIGFHLTEDNATIDINRLVEDDQVDAILSARQPDRDGEPCDSLCLVREG